MTHFQRIGRSLFLPALTVLLTACAGSGAARTTETGYLHAYDLETGLVLRYETITSTSMTMNNPLTGGEAIEMSMPIVNRIEITGREGEDFIGTMTIEEFSMEGLGGMFAAAGEAIDFTDMAFDFTLGTDGRSQMDFSLPGLEVTGGMTTSQGLGQYFIPWPSYPIEVGATWTDTTSQEAEIGGTGGMAQENISRYTYRGLLESETGEPPARVVQATVEGSLVGGGSDQEMGIDMTMSGTWTGETTYRFDPRTGLLESAEGSVEVEMFMEIASMGVSMPMMMTTSFSARRLK